MKKEEEVLVEGAKMKFTLGNPEERVADILAKKKKMDKQVSMQMALTYIEIQGMRKVTPEEAIEIADKFLEWLEK